MGNDAQIEITTNSNDRVTERTNELNITKRTVTSLDYKGLLWSCSLRKICLTALWLPLGALMFCYVTASIFQADDIHETHCRVYNVVPSISAITGISPQRYIWRICIAYHLGPRLLIGSLYYNYHKERTSYITEEKVRNLAEKLGEACYWLNLIELFALTGVTYVSNRENYFIHEKIFIVFMIATLLHMLCRARVGCVGSDSVEPVRTNKIVWILFFVAIAATLGLIFFFLRHRLLCRPLVLRLIALKLLKAVILSILMLTQFLHVVFCLRVHPRNCKYGFSRCCGTGSSCTRTASYLSHSSQDQVI